MGFEDWGTTNTTSNLSSRESDQRKSEAELNRLRTEADRLGASAKSHSDNIDKARKQTESIEKSIEDYRKEIQRIESRIDELKYDRRKENDRLDEVKRKIHQTEQAMIGLDNNDLKWNLNNRLLDLKEHASVIHGNIEKIKSRVFSLGMDQESIKTKIFSAKQSLDSGTRKLSSLEDEASSIQQQLDSIQRDVSTQKSALDQPKKNKGTGFAAWSFSDD